MIPMFRTLASSVAVAVAATVSDPRSLLAVLMLVRYAYEMRFSRVRLLPPVVGERLVGLGHLVRVLTALDARAEPVAGVEQLVHEPLGHRLLPARRGVGDQPAQGERGAPGRADLDRDLVGRAADPAAADLEGRLDVVERALERQDRIGDQLTLGRGALTRHLSSSPSSRRNDCGPACGCARPECRANRG